MKKIIPSSNTLRRLGELVKLNKVGINYFSRCPWCNDPGAHLCFPDGLKSYVCLNYGCKAKGTIEQFFVHFNSADQVAATQTKIL